MKENRLEQIFVTFFLHSACTANDVSGKDGPRYEGVPRKIIMEVKGPPSFCTVPFLHLDMF
jgi:hypothetical protein